MNRREAALILELSYVLHLFWIEMRLKLLFADILGYIESGLLQRIKSGQTTASWCCSITRIGVEAHTWQRRLTRRRSFWRRTKRWNWDRVLPSVENGSVHRKIALLLKYLCIAWRLLWYLFYIVGLSWTISRSPLFNIYSFLEQGSLLTSCVL